MSTNSNDAEPCPEPQITNEEEALPKNLQVAINFDTTGSMAPCIAELKKNVTSFLAEIASQFSDVTLKTRVSANGDYQDADEHGGYVFTCQEQWTSTSRSCEFLQNVGPTCGFDVPEAYEVALDRIARYDWDPLAAKALIFIGDAMPHPPSYVLNREKLDWKSGVEMLVGKGVSLYCVQCLKSNGDRTGATAFWKEFAEISGGQHLCLDQLRNAEKFILVILLHLSQRPLLESRLTSCGALRIAHSQLFGATLDGVSVHSPASPPGRPDDGRFQSFHVTSACSIKEFVVGLGIQFAPGKGFYELSKGEKIAKNKEVLIFLDEGGATRVTQNSDARVLLGLPSPGASDSQLTLAAIPLQYRGKVYIQSTSYNRKLIAGTNFLYEVPEELEAFT